MKLLPSPSQTLDVSTSFGFVRVYEWATPQTRSATPIVLIPGRSAGVPMWASNLHDFVAKHPVYAMDALGDAGMSVQTVKIENGANQATWLHEVLSSLNVTKVHIVGHSFGGWAAANYSNPISFVSVLCLKALMPRTSFLTIHVGSLYATRYPEKVASLILLEPVFVFQGLKTEIILKTIPAAIPFLPKSWRERMLEYIGGIAEIDQNDPATRMIVEGTEYYAQKLPGLLEQITPEQLQSRKMHATPEFLLATFVAGLISHYLRSVYSRIPRSCH